MNITFDGRDLVLLILIISRIAGITASAPVFSDRAIPVQIKIGLALMAALTVFPSLRESGLLPEFYTPLSLFIIVVKETIVGISIGYIARLFFYALQMAASMVDFQMGLSMAEVYDPSSGTHISPLGQLINWIAIIVFLGINGHHRLIAALTNSFSLIPLGGLDVQERLLSIIVKQIGHTTQVAFGLFGPVLLILGITELALGIVSKAAPQMNIFAVSLPLKIGLGIIVFIFWIATLPSPLAQALGAHIGGLRAFTQALIR